MYEDYTCPVNASERIGLLEVLVRVLVPMEVLFPHGAVSSIGRLVLKD